MAVIHARPRLASQAPNVSITIINIDHEAFIMTIIIIIRLRIIASNARRAISKCCR